MHLELLFKHNNVESRIKVAVGVDNVQLVPVLSDFPATTYNADPPLLGLTMVGACIPNPANPAALSHLT